MAMYRHNIGLALLRIFLGVFFLFEGIGKLRWFVDSSILGVLVGGLRRARERDVPFGLVLGGDAHPAIRRIFELTGLHDVFPIYATRELAQAGLSGQDDGA